MAWIFLVLAGCFEVVGVIGMNKVTERKCFSSFAVLIVGFLLSFGLLSLALRTLPLGMSYAIWTGIGSVGATLVGMIFYGDSRCMTRILLFALVRVSIAGLILIS